MIYQMMISYNLTGFSDTLADREESLVQLIAQL
jgi:hypothetical protein